MKTIYLAIAMLVVATMIAPAIAATCYVKEGNSCRNSTMGNLDSTCTKACTVGFRKVNGRMQLACLS